ncbi:hypothetical protein BFJ72_g14959 [Fusarium proliferatum]|uniref:Uncharacterized protein n=2 Tax=Fusarium TaxID=5506 RepID=A0A420RV99_GIBIN|nr:hypothetical protein BFJ72_g14959 [Fusarium proliferatum]
MNRGQAGEIDPDFQRTFWVIYSLESEFCFNTGRASAIPYHDISCPIPHTSVSLNSNFNWLQVLSSYALMISRIYERLFSVKAKSLSKDVRRTEALRAFEELENWKDSIPESFCPGMPIRSHRLGKSQAVALAVQICFCYHNVRIALSRVSISASTGDFENQMRYKLSLTDSARAIIEVVHLIHLEPFVLPWIQYHMPQSALFLLFDFIIENPYHEETQKDLSYMQMVASYFMRFQYATKDNADSTLSTELYQIASKFLEDVASSQNSEPQTGDDPDSLEQWLSYNNDLNTNLLNELLGSQNQQQHNQPVFALTEAILKQQGDNKPLGKHWTTRFVKRHLQLSTKLGKHLEAARFDGFTPKAVNWYFDIRETEYGWIKPENTVNVDEGGIMAGFGLDSLVIGSSDPKKKALLKGVQSRTWTSFIEAVTATGRALKPGIIFKGKKLQKQWFLNEFELIADWHYITSPNGWTDNHIALEWLKDVYLPQTEPRDASDARLIILDGHGSHAQDEWMATCFLNNVYCCYLPAHCSHGLQPLDNRIFNVIKGAYRKELQKLASLTDSAPVDKVNFIRAYAKAREAGMRKEIILSGWRFTGNWPINRHKALTHPEIQPDKEKLLEEFKTPSPPQLHSDDTPKTSRQMREMAKHRSRPTRRKYSKIAKGLEALEMKVAVQNARITGLEEQMAQVRRGKKRKAVPNPNRRFMALAETLTTGEALPDSKKAEIEVDVDEKVESVIEVGVRSEDESDDFRVVTKHCQRTRSGREVKKPRRE